LRGGGGAVEGLRLPIVASRIGMDVAHHSP